ncbi:MAG TPA: PAS domain S-box protein, partial [Balneolaceae bacterium]|nr:PAS domain S-box protein [Balneolaceae bacterium]
IIERIEYQHQLKEEKEFSEAVIDSMPGLFFMIDKNFNLRRWNNNLEWVTGYSAFDLSVMNFFELFSEQDHEQVNEQCEKAFETGDMTMEVSAVNKKNEDIQLIITGKRLYYGDRYFIVGTGIDISDRLKAERKLEQEKEFEQNIINSLPGIFFFYDPDREQIKVNDKFYEELGYTREEVAEADPYDFFAPDEHEEICKRIQKISRNGESSSVRKVVKADGSVVNYYFESRRFEQDGSKFIIGTGIDVTARLEAEHKLEASLEEKKVLLAEIHHRVKNNLAIITGLLELQYFSTEDEKVKEILRDSQARIRSMALVHEQLYQFENFSQIKLDQYLARLLESVTEAIDIQDKDITVGIESDPVEMTITQAVPCGLMLSEILTNAHKHAFKGLSKGQIDIEVHQNGQVVSISIADNGRGLPKDFDIEDSDSLGMSLIQTLVQQLDAELTIDRQEGSCFYFQFELK